MLNLLGETPLWPYLQQAKKPIVLYGMGDGALKIMKVLERFEIPLAGFFASDEFVRGHSFCGYPVRSLAQTKAEFGEVIILLAFGTERDDMLAVLDKLNRENELYAPDVPVCLDDDTLFDEAYVTAHQAQLWRVYNALADQQSKDTFLAVLRYKLSGKIQYLFDCATPTDEVFDALIPLDDAEDYVDLGAYNGDTVARFLAQVGDYHSICAWEPDLKNYHKLCKNTADLPRMQALNLGAHDKPDTLIFASKAGRQSALATDGAQKGVETAVSSVDAELSGNRASYIKFDVEGAEEQALIGCKNTIKQYYPKLALSAYHRNSDLWRLPEVLWSITSEYQLYLRHHPYVPAWETNFYAHR